MLTVIPLGAVELRTSKTAEALAAFGTKKKSVAEFWYAIKSSITPPLALQIKVYWACPGLIRFKSFVKALFKNCNDPSPTTDIFPRCETSKTPTWPLTELYSSITPVF